MSTAQSAYNEEQAKQAFEKAEEEVEELYDKVEEFINGNTEAKDAGGSLTNGAAIFGYLANTSRDSFNENFVEKFQELREATERYFDIVNQGLKENDAFVDEVKDIYSKEAATPGA